MPLDPEAIAYNGNATSATSVYPNPSVTSNYYIDSNNQVPISSGQLGYASPSPRWEDMCNQEKFDHLRTLFNGMNDDLTRSYTRIRELEDLMSEHRHTSDGRLMVEYKRKY